jgi:hypothetical protein
VPVCFALGAVGPVPFVVEETEGVLTSTATSVEEKKDCIAKLMEKATPISDVRASKEYRQAMLTVLGQRALTTAILAFEDLRIGNCVEKQNLHSISLIVNQKRYAIDVQAHHTLSGCPARPVGHYRSQRVLCGRRMWSLHHPLSMVRRLTLA